MHFLLTAIGSYGDVLPTVGLGAELARRHHRVTLLTNPYFAEVVQAAGLELASYGTAEEYTNLTNHPSLWHPTRSMPLVFSRAVFGKLPMLYELVRGNYQPGETVIVAHMLDVASRVLRELEGAPFVSALLAPSSLWSDYRAPRLMNAWTGPHVPRWFNRLQMKIGNWLVLSRMLTRPLNQFRGSMGLPPVRTAMPDWWQQADLSVALFPDWFGPVQPDWPRPLVTTNFPLWDTSSDAAKLPAEVEDFLAAGSPPVVFTPGSANRQAQKFFAAAIGACERLPCRGLLVTKYAEQLPAMLPERVLRVPFVPLSALLPRVAAVVHHGGIGTCAQSLAAGVPQLVQPLAFDQLDNGMRLVELGVARVVRPAQFTADRVAHVLGELCSSHAINQTAGDLADDTKSGLPAAADAIERFAAERR